MKIITRITPSSISQFAEVPDSISGIAYSDAEKSLVFFSHEKGDVGFVSDHEITYVPRRLEVPSPMGIFCDPLGIIVFQLADSILWKFNQSFKMGSCSCGSKTFVELKACCSFGKSRNAVPVSFCRMPGNIIAIATPKSNKVVSVSMMNATTLIGSSKRGFSMSNKPTSSMMDSPSGVCFDHKRGTLMISDTGNGVIRRLVNEKEILPIGMPRDLQSKDGEFDVARFAMPTTIRFQGNDAYVVDVNTIRKLSLDDKKVSTIYVSSRKIVDIVAGDGSVFALEES